MTEQDQKRSKSLLSEAFLRKFADKEFRDEYVADQVRSRIALLIRALREQDSRAWTQGDLGKKADKPQSVISRIEDPDYGKVSLQTLLEIAAAFELPLFVDIPEWSDWFHLMTGFSQSDLERESFDLPSLLAAIAKPARERPNVGLVHYFVDDPQRPKVAIEPNNTDLLAQ